MAVFAVYTFTSSPPSHPPSFFELHQSQFSEALVLSESTNKAWWFCSRQSRRRGQTTRLFVISSHSNPKLVKSNRKSRFGQPLSPYDSDGDDEGAEYDEEEDEEEYWDDDDDLFSEDELTDTEASDGDKGRFKSKNSTIKTLGKGQSGKRGTRSLRLDPKDSELKTSKKNSFRRLSEELDIDEKWIPLLDYLSTFGLKDSHFIQIYERHMPSLQINVVSARERLDYLVSVGVKQKDIRKILLRQPQILGYTVEKNLKSHVAFLTDLGIPDTRIGQIITATPSLFSYSVENSLKPTVRYLLEEVGIRKSDLCKVVQLSPQILVQKIDSSWNSRFMFLTKELGAPRDSIVKMVTKHPQLLHYSIEDGLLPRINFLRSIGMRNSDILKVSTSLTQPKMKTVIEA